MTEHEIKGLLTAESYARCLAAARALSLNEVQNAGETACTERLQINYYYDTARHELHKNGVTLRIRQNGSRLQGQIKRHDKGATGDSNETYFAVERLPKHIDFEGRRAVLLGSLVTRRTVFELEGCEVDIDANYYLGVTDYELEIEYPDGEAAKALDLAFRLTGGLPEKHGGKYSRFLKALKLTGKTAVQAEADGSLTEIY